MAMFRDLRRAGVRQLEPRPQHVGHPYIFYSVRRSLFRYPTGTLNLLIAGVMITLLVTFLLDIRTRIVAAAAALFWSMLMFVLTFTEGDLIG
jgi:hypothetical protein